MHKTKVMIFVFAIILISCGISQVNGTTATEEKKSTTPNLANTKIMTRTTTYTSTYIILPTKIPTSTQYTAQDLGITADEVIEAFNNIEFTYSTPTEVNGLEYIKGQAADGRMLELYAKGGGVIYAEASVENRGPQTNPSILFQLLETIQKDPERIERIERWLDEDAPGAADKSPLMEVTYIDEDNIFYTYAHDEEYTRIYFKIYVLTWLIDMDIVK